jgi:hypothetical protein
MRADLTGNPVGGIDWGRIDRNFRHIRNQFSVLLHRGVMVILLIVGAKLGEDLLLRLLADGAGVEQQHVGPPGSSVSSSPSGHPRRVILVHLAAKGFDIELSGHFNSQSMRMPPFWRLFSLQLNPGLPGIALNSQKIGRIAIARPAPVSRKRISCVLRG